MGQIQAIEYLRAASEYDRLYGAPQERSERAAEAAANEITNNVLLGYDVLVPVDSPEGKHYPASSFLTDVDAVNAGRLFTACHHALAGRDANAAATLIEFVDECAKDYAMNNAECWL